MTKAALALGAFLLVAVSSYFMCFNYVDATEVGIARDALTGELTLQGPGWHFTPPLVRVARVSTQPVRVGISTTSRAYDQKLVEFVPEHYKEFVETEGFRYYWWANRLSFNFGYPDEYRGMRDILRGYAYSSKKYPFIKVLESYKQE